ncbi:MAG TPA: hypothetical protein VGN32_11740 [Ktedonobacterales bacterium]|jgi:hypothetical protein|nr:hypothetical protein [Ktedonobacterales bacterium]
MDNPSTKRDQRREARKAQFQQQQAERRRIRQRARQMQLAKRYGFIGGGILIVLLLGLLVAHFAFSGSQPGSFALPAPQASGNPIDGISCLGTEQVAQHIHAELEVYVNGQRGTVPQGVGIVPAKNCLYFTHTHQPTGMIHVESPDSKAVYTLGNFFHVWGQPLSGAQMFGYKVDASHKLTVVLYDANGHKSTYTGDPAAIPLANHETIVLLYNSPSVATSAFTLPAGITDWGSL